jgi:hypothetical protein
MKTTWGPRRPGGPRAESARITGNAMIGEKACCALQPLVNIARAMIKLCRLIALSFISCVALAACSSSDTTIVALTINSGSEIGVVTKLRVTITPSSGAAPTTEEFVPTLDTTPDSGGVIAPSFFHRIQVAGDPAGPASITIEALNANNAVFAVGATTADLRSHGATTASVKLMLGTMLPTPDGGSDAHSGDAGDAGTAGDAPAGDGGNG